MNWLIEEEENTGLLRVTFNEEFSLREIDGLAQSLESEGYLHNRLFNFQGCAGLAPTTTELLDIARRSADWDLEQTKVAWLAANQSDAALLRVITSKFSERVMKVFTSEPEAVRWLTGQNTVVQDSPGRVDHHPVRLRGEVNARMVMKIQQEMKDAVAHSPSRPVLWDLRECQIQQSLDELKEIAVDLAASYRGSHPDFKNAVLVDSHFMEMIVKEMGKAAELDENDPIVVFRSYRDAIAYLAN